MTNYESIKAMDKYELVEFLSSILDGEAIRIMDKYELANFLSRFRDCKKCPASEKFCDGQRDCVDAILIWLNAESDDDTVDMIHHPNHYTWRGTEAIDIVRAMTRGSEGVEAYLLGCTVKYMYRFPKKNGAQDLDKAVQCLKMLREIRYGKPTPTK